MIKTYITPKMKEPELVVQPAGKKDPQGNRIPRKTIQFRPNGASVGQYTTSDPKEQEFLDSHEYMTTGEMMVMMVMGAESDLPAAESKTRVGVQTSSDDTPPAPPAADVKPARAARVKK